METGQLESRQFKPHVPAPDHAASADDSDTGSIALTRFVEFGKDVEAAQTEASHSEAARGVRTAVREHPGDRLGVDHPGAAGGQEQALDPAPPHSVRPMILDGKRGRTSRLSARCDGEACHLVPHFRRRPTDERRLRRARSLACSTAAMRRTSWGVGSGRRGPAVVRRLGLISSNIYFLFQ